MAYATSHSIEHHRHPKNVGAFEIEKHSSPPIILPPRSSHRSKCRSMSSFSIRSSNTNTSSSLSSSNYLHQENHMFNQSIITNRTNTNPITSSPAISFPSRIPFSWEKLPGIPKQQNQDSKKKLPLPPAAATITTGKTSKCNGQKIRNNQAYSSKRHSISSSEEMMGSFLEDPFFMAMVECSKDRNWREATKLVTTRRSRGRRSISSIVTSHLSDRIGMMNMYGSCKSSCTVKESSIIVRLPSTRTYTETLFGLGHDRGGGGGCSRSS